MSKVKARSDLFEKKGKFLFKYLPMPSYAWQKIKEDLILIDFNDAAYDITKGNIEEFLGIKATELYRNQPETISDLQRCFKEKSNFFKEMNYKFELDDKERYLSVNYGFIPPDIVIVHTNDLTEKKKAEIERNELGLKLKESQKALKKLNKELEHKILDKTKELKESEGKYRILFENAQEEQDLTRALLDNQPDFIYFKDRKTRFRHVSKHFYEFFGSTKKDIIGKTDFDLFPEELAKVSHYEELQVINTGTPIINKEESNAGTWVLTTKIPWTDKNGNIKGLFGISRDITERKKAEQRLKESEQHHRLITENINDIIGIINDQFKIEYFNEKVLKELSGYSSKERIGKSPLDLIHPDDYEKIKKTFNKTFKTGEGLEEFRFNKKNGDYFWVEIKGKTFIDIDGKKKLLTVSRDITERKRAEEKLRESEEKYRNITEHAIVGIAILHHNEVKYVNKQLADIFGYTIDEIMSWGDKGFLDAIHPEDRDLVMQQAIKKQSGDADIIDQYQFRGIKKNGENIWLEIYSKSINYEGDLADFAMILDITEQKKAEAALNIEKQFTEDIINTTSDTIFVFEPETGKAIRWNKAFNDVSGYTNEEIYSMKAPDSYYNEDDLVSAAEAINKISEEGEVTVEMSLISKDGRSILFEYSARSFRTSDGRELLVAYGRDVTERKEAEEKLQYQAKLVENVSDAIISTDLDFNIITWNKAAEKIYGWKSDEVLEKSIADTIPVNYPYDDEEVVLRQFLEQGFWKGEVIQPRKDGNSIYILTSVSLIKDITSKPIGAVAINRDITERKKSEEKIANLARFPAENPNPILRSNIKEVMYINQAGQNLFNRKRGDKNPAKLLNCINIALTENTVKTLEVNLEEKLYSFDITPIQEKGYVNIYGRDITVRKEAEKQLRESEKNYREAYDRANFYKDLFAHDINNIMQVINSSAELIIYYLNSFEKIDEIDTIAQMIKKQVTRAKLLVHNVNTLSELEEGTKPIKIIEAYELLQNSVNYVRTAYQERAIDISVESFSDRIFVQANELLQDAFDNIIINAVKYNDKSLIEILINVSKEKKGDNKYLRFEFIDNGIGIQDEKKEIIFKKGHRESKGQKGMGLGLSLVKKIIEGFNGEIWVENRIKDDYTKGSNFVILIPEPE